MNWKPILSVILVVTTAPAQTVYHLPFASLGNAIELVVANTSPVEATNVTVSVQNVPVGLQFAQKEQRINSIAAGGEQRAVFVFAVEKSAPVGEEHRLQFRISAGDGQSWTKEIPILVSAPERFELFQNYPNPFNPTTAIAYQLPVAAHVSLRIFNMVGQEVATPFQGEQQAGFHQAIWNAKGFASGVYVYRLDATDERGKGFRAMKTMILLR